ncbi:unnamed protein product [Brassica oleracea]
MLCVHQMWQIRGIDKHLFIDHSVAVPFTSAQLVDLSQVEDPKLGSPSTYKDQRYQHKECKR